MPMSYDDFVAFMQDEKGKILDWGQAESEALRDKYPSGDFRRDLAGVWIDYYAALKEMTDEVAKTSD